MHLAPAEALTAPPKIMGEAVKIIGGPYNGMKGNIAKLCDTFCSVVIDFEHKWFEVVTEHRWLAPLGNPTAPTA